MNLIKPNKIKNGATIGFLSVCGPVEDRARIEKAKRYFEEKGYRVVISDTTYVKKDFLCANDETRVKTFEEFFLNPEIDAILCTRGGYGAIRIIDKINYDIVKKNPKYFGGFSDVTALLCSITKHAGLETYHSPMPYPDFGGDTVSELTENSFFDSLEQKFSPIRLEGTVLSKGTNEGVLWGGNLATLASMAGFDFVPDEKFILFVEDVNEPAYKLDRYMTQLMFLPSFKENLKGVVIGEFTGLDEAQYFNNSFKELGENLNIPIISGLQVGHVKDKLTLPLGRKCRLDSGTKTLEFLE